MAFIWCSLPLQLEAVLLCGLFVFISLIIFFLKDSGSGDGVWGSPVAVHDFCAAHQTGDKLLNEYLLKATKNMLDIY